MEALRWPNGPTCPHCNEDGRSIKVGGAKRSHRDGLHHCKSCRKQFTVTVGTALERTRVSLVNWMRLAHLLSRIKGRSLKVPEVRAVIDVPYKTAVRMLDRVCDPLVTYKGKLDARKFGKCPSGLDEASEGFTLVNGAEIFLDLFEVRRLTWATR